MKSKQKNIALACAIGALLLISFSNAEPAVAQSQIIPVERLLNPDGTINTTTGVNGTLDLRGWNVTLDSERGPILVPQQEPLAPSQAQPTDQWWALPHGGLDRVGLPCCDLPAVYALAISGSTLYVGGSFNMTADQNVWPLDGIAAFDGTNWHGLPDNKLEGDVFALAVTVPCRGCASVLYIGGDFLDTVHGSQQGIIKFNIGTDTWSSLPNEGLDNSVDALAVIGNDLYVGGKFTATWDAAVTNLNHIAKFDGANWSALPHNGLNDTVYSLAVSGSDLYAGGGFTGTADGALTRNHIAKLSSGVWVVLPNLGLNNDVQALAVDGTDIYVGGLFTQTADGTVSDLNRIAKYDTSGNTWSALPHHGLSGAVLSLAVFTPCQSCLNVVYVGGGFSETADGAVPNLNHMAKLHFVFGQGMVWSPLPNHGLDGAVNTVAGLGGDLYVGGVFTQTQDGAVKNMKLITRLAPTWTILLPLVDK